MDASCSVVTNTTTLAHHGRRGGVHPITAAHHDEHKDRRSWMDSCDLLSEFTKMGQRRAQRGAGHLKDPFERPIEFQD